MSKPTIEFAPQDKVEELEPWVNAILNALGYPEAFVTDESLIWDFLCVLSEAEREAKYAELSKALLGATVTSGTYIYELARDVKRRYEAYKQFGIAKGKEIAMAHKVAIVGATIEGGDDEE